MMNEQDISNKFKANKLEFSDEGFSERVVGLLPERNSLLPQIVMGAFITLGMILMFVFQVFAPILEQINSLVNSISRLQIPSASAIITYFIVLGLIGLIGYSVLQADTG